MWYLCYFLHRHLDFRMPELESLYLLATRQQQHAGEQGQRQKEQKQQQEEEVPCSDGLGVLRWRKPEGDHLHSPFFYVDFPSEEVAEFVAKRSILLKGVFEVWGEGSTLEACEAAVKAFRRSRLPKQSGDGREEGHPGDQNSVQQKGAQEEEAAAAASRGRGQALTTAEDENKESSQLGRTNDAENEGSSQIGRTNGADNKNEGEGGCGHDVGNGDDASVGVGVNDHEVFTDAATTFKFVVDGFGKVVSLPEQIEHMERFHFLPFKGRVDLKRPKHTFWIIHSRSNCAAASSAAAAAAATGNSNPSSAEAATASVDDITTADVEAGSREKRGKKEEAEDPRATGATDSCQEYAQDGEEDEDGEVEGGVFNNGLPPDLPSRVFFARQVALSDRKVVTKYELRGRRYLGPTAMDAELALLMANQALACRGGLVFDPFVGTGSILVAAAHYGALTMGADIDIRVVRDGRGPQCNVWANFKQYGLTPPVGLLRADNNCPPWRQRLEEVFDAIICDPPYGVRAGGRKSGGRKILKGLLSPYTIPDELKADHIPSTAPYTLAECLHDLLNLAAQTLRLGGRLVYFFPAARLTYSDAQLPRHPCLRLVSNSEQILTRRWSRRLLTMEKCFPYSEEVQEQYAADRAEFRKNHADLAAAEKKLLEKLLKEPLRDETYGSRRTEDGEAEEYNENKRRGKGARQGGTCLASSPSQEDAGSLSQGVFPLWQGENGGRETPSGGSASFSTDMSPSVCTLVDEVRHIVFASAPAYANAASALTSGVEGKSSVEGPAEYHRRASMTGMVGKARHGKTKQSRPQYRAKNV